MSLTGSSISERADLTAADILDRRVGLTWYEAVAIVRAVSELVTETAEPQGIPELDQIHLSAEGSIDLSGAAIAKEPVRRLGQLLQALIAHSDPPVQLRLIISQATAPSSSYESVRDYWEALAYFERPQREALLRTLYTRAITAAAGSEFTMSTTLDELAPLRQWTDQSEATLRPGTLTRFRFQRRFVALAILIVVALTAGLVYLRMRSFQPRTRATVSVAAERASNALGDAVASGMSAITERLGLGRMAPATAVSQPAVVAEPPKRPASAVKRPSQLLSSQPTSFVAFDLQPDDPPVAAVRDRADSQTIPSDPPVSANVATDDATLYGPDSEGVSPPVGIRPQLPRELPDGIAPTQLSRIEIVVRTDGTVDSVKLLGQPRDVIDALFLSVAKAWRFQPAMKNGMPVRYRKTIWIAAQ
jgi:Gram-negative bacterial TonB protein C-terminal